MYLCMTQYFAFYPYVYILDYHYRNSVISIINNSSTDKQNYLGFLNFLDYIHTYVYVCNLKKLYVGIPTYKKSTYINLQLYN